MVCITLNLQPILVVIIGDRWLVIRKAAAITQARRQVALPGLDFMPLLAVLLKPSRAPCW